RQDPHLRADDRRVPAGRGRRLVAGPGPGSAGADLARGGAPHRLRDRLHRQGAAGPRRRPGGGGAPLAAMTPARATRPWPRRRRTGGGGTSFAAMTSARGTRTWPRRVITSTLVSSLPAMVPRASVIDSPCGERSASIA